MNTPPPDDDSPHDRNPNKKSPERTFEALMRSHAKQIENLPPEMRIPAMPPSEGEAEEVKKYVREKMGLKMSECPSSKIFLATEILDRSNILEGRFGEWRGLVAFLFLYRFGKTLKTIFVSPVDGLDVRLIAKAIIWGYIADLPPQYAQSEICSSDRFFDVKTFDAKKIYSNQLLEKYKEECRAAIYGDLTHERVIREMAEKYAAGLKKQIAEQNEEKEALKLKLTDSYETSFRWSIAFAVALILIPIAAIAVDYFKI